MAYRKIRMLGDEILRKQSKIVKDFDKPLAELLDDMADTLKKENGAGLSAVQVGILKRIFITHTDGELVEFINPQITQKSKKCKILTEGCLSVPDLNGKIRYGKVKRPITITVKAQDRNGKTFERTFSDYSAQAVCHENDHLNGVLYIDIEEPTQKKITKPKENHK